MHTHTHSERERENRFLSASIKPKFSECDTTGPAGSADSAGSGCWKAGLQVNLQQIPSMCVVDLCITADLTDSLWLRCTLLLIQLRFDFYLCVRYFMPHLKFPERQTFQPQLSANSQVFQLKHTEITNSLVASKCASFIFVKPPAFTSCSLSTISEIILMHSRLQTLSKY